MSRVESTEQNWTIGGLLNWTARFLTQKGAEFPRLDAEVLLAHALGCKRIDLYGALHNDTAGDEVRQRYRELIRRRLEGCPVAYLVGRKEFFSMEFEVTPAVLIPRPDSELVVMEALALAKKLPQPRLLDLGTGSGNLTVAFAKHHKGARVTTVDFSSDALAVARRNAERHGVSDRIQFLQGDLFAPLPSGERFDFIVSNPPYIAHEEMDQLPIGVRDYEPHQALDGGPGGFKVLERIVAGAKDHLVAGGWLILEIGSPQEATARALFERHPAYELGKTIHDASGYPRALRARLGDGGK
jgi:release factor glutamine methyltransferase